MADPTRERPAIHVCLAGPSAPGLYRWVEVGAEEEGVPTRHVALAIDDVAAAAYAAAQGSRFGIGVAIGQGRVLLHEAHMPPAQPVLSFELGPDGAHACRLMGGNAARMVVRLPLRLEDELLGPSEAGDGQRGPVPAQRGYGAGLARAGALDVALVTQVTTIVARILRERGIL